MSINFLQIIIMFYKIQWIKVHTGQPSRVSSDLFNIIRKDLGERLNGQKSSTRLIMGIMKNSSCDTKK
jgi:hypothetical protein